MESIDDKRKRLGRERQARHRAKKRAEDESGYKAQNAAYKRAERLRKNPAPPGAPKPLPHVSGIDGGKKDRKAITELVAVLTEMLASNKDISSRLPEIRKIAERSPEIAKLIQSYDGCEDLKVKLASREAEVQRLNPRKRGPTEKTQKESLGTVKALYKAMTGDKFDCKSFEWARDTDKVLEFINTYPKLTKETSRNLYRSRLGSVLRNLEGFDREYKIYSELSSDVFKNVISKQIGENKLSPEQQAKYMDWEELTSKLESEWPDTTSEARALTSLYVLRPPRRTKDYGLLKVIKRKNKSVSDDSIKGLPTSFNYLVLDKRGNPTDLIFNEYKTKREFGKQEYPVTGELRKVLKSYIDEAKINNGEFLFSKDNGKPWGTEFSNLIGDYFEDLVGKRMGSTLLRHSFITYILNKQPRESLNVREKIARDMAHSLAVQGTYEVLPDEKKEEDALNLIDADEAKTKKK